VPDFNQIATGIELDLIKSAGAEEPPLVGGRR
jgi:hypothetical protein